MAALGFLVLLMAAAGVAAACGDQTGPEIAAPAANPTPTAVGAVTPASGGGEPFASCADSASWLDASLYVDQQIALQGRVVSAEQVVQGGDPFIQLEIGVPVAEPGGVDVFIPSYAAPAFNGSPQTEYGGHTVCVRGVLLKQGQRYALYIENATDIADVPAGTPRPVVETAKCSDAVPWQDAAAHANDSRVDVTGPVVGMRASRGLNDSQLLEVGTATGPGGFDVAIPAYAIGDFDLTYQGKTICVRGAVSVVDGRARIIVDQPAAIVVDGT